MVDQGTLYLENIFTSKKSIFIFSLTFTLLPLNLLVSNPPPPPLTLFLSNLVSLTVLRRNGVFLLFLL